MHKVLTFRVFIVLVLSFSSPIFAQKSSATYQNYNEMKLALINDINKAKNRIWLTSYYFTDNEIATALFVAKYRNIDVNILVDAAKANAHMSRVRFFKNNRVPIFQLPPNFTPASPSAVLIDSNLIVLDTPLNFMNTQRTIHLTLANQHTVTLFENSFAAALKKPIDPYYTPPPLQINNDYSSDKKQKYYLPQFKQNSTQQSSSYRGKSIFKTDLDEDTFVYSLEKEDRPAYIPSQLPSTTLSGEGNGRKQSQSKKKNEPRENPWQ